MTKKDIHNGDIIVFHGRKNKDIRLGKVVNIDAHSVVVVGIHTGELRPMRTLYGGLNVRFELITQVIHVPKTT